MKNLKAYVRTTLTAGLILAAAVLLPIANK